MTLSAVICGADNWVAIEEFCKAKKDWLTDVLKLKNGIPSHDTFGNVFAMIDTEQFSESFTHWMRDIATLSDNEVIAVDGKCLRGTKEGSKSAIYMVSAWACENKCVLGQQVVDEKSNEITAVPKLLKKLNLTGVTVTADAMGCQRDLSKQIAEQGGDYLFCLKGNQGTLHDDVVLWFKGQFQKQFKQHETLDGGHGRVEHRLTMSTSDIDWLQDNHNWPYLKSITAVISKREVRDGEAESGYKESLETRYFISSLSADRVDKISTAIRAHWGIENQLHWSLDMSFDEDHSRARVGNSAANLSTIRHIALNLINKEKTAKVGVKTKRLKAGWNERYLQKIIRGI
jgi:predicted transposase YbfD/YdcC